MAYKCEEKRKEKVNDRLDRERDGCYNYVWRAMENFLNSICDDEGAITNEDEVVIDIG